jgi:hypothetical protein
MSRRRFSTLLAATAAAALAPKALAQPAPGGAQAVLARARAASGGGAWTTLRGLHETGMQDGRPYERWVDVLRWGDRLDTGAAGPGRRTYGYNGFGAWWRPVGTRTEPGGEREVLLRARTEAFLAAYGFYFSGRFDQRNGYVGGREAGGRRYTVVWVQPAGGEQCDLWFDQSAGLLARIVDRGQRARTVELSDYRRVGRLMLPFKRVTYGGDLNRPSERIAERVEAAAPDRALFSLPRPGA